MTQTSKTRFMLSSGLKAAGIWFLGALGVYNLFVPGNDVVSQLATALAAGLGALVWGVILSRYAYERSLTLSHWSLGVAVTLGGAALLTAGLDWLILAVFLSLFGYFVLVPRVQQLWNSRQPKAGPTLPLGHPDHPYRDR